jgi:hypothetical protein
MPQGALVAAAIVFGVAWRRDNTPAMRLADLQPGAYRIEVAQLSATFGPGPFRAIEIAG